MAHPQNRPHSVDAATGDFLFELYKFLFSPSKCQKRAAANGGFRALNNGDANRLIGHNSGVCPYGPRARTSRRCFVFNYWEANSYFRSDKESAS